MPRMFATTSFWLHLAAVTSLFPLGVISWRGRPGSTLYWMLSAAATVALLGWVLTRLDHGWIHGFSASLDIIIVVTLTSFLVLSVFSRALASLAPLVLAYCIPLGLIAVLATSNSPQSGELSDERLDAWFWTHIVIAVSAFAMASLAAIAGLAVLLRERMLKLKRQSEFVNRLPAMADAEKLQFHLLQGCALLLAAVLATGMATGYASDGTLIQVDHKSLLTVIAFLLVLFLLSAHRWFGWRGRKAVRIVLAVQLLLTLGYPGVKFVTDILAN